MAGGWAAACRLLPPPSTQPSTRRWRLCACTSSSPSTPNPPRYKIIIGGQYGRGVWFGPVYPNRTTGKEDAKAYPCADGCLYDIQADPTEHVNLKGTLPGVYASMLAKLLEHGKTVYQTDYAEPGTAACFTGQQAAAYYVGHNTCIKGRPGYNPSLPSCDANRRQLYLGPMCFATLPPTPPTPPTPAPPPSPPPPPPRSLAPAVGGGCLVTTGQQFAPVVLGACADGKHWGGNPGQSGWVLWAGASYIKVDEQQVAGIAAACKRGTVYVNKAQGPPGAATAQGFTVRPGPAPSQVQLVSSACKGMCLGFPAAATATAAAAAHGPGPQATATATPTACSANTTLPGGRGCAPAPGASPTVMECAQALPWVMA